MYKYKHKVCNECSNVLLDDVICSDCGGNDFGELDVLGCWGISNTASLNVFRIDSNNDRVLVGINDFTPKWIEIEFIEDSSELRSGIRWGDSVFFMDECIRV